jgi:hypothetical protein
MNSITFFRAILLTAVISLAGPVLAATDEASIVPGVSLEGIALGPNGLNELKKLGKPDRIDRGMSQTRQVWRSLRPEGRVETIFIHTVNNGVIDAKPADGLTIDLIRTSMARFQTVSGIRVGSTLDQIRKSFPDIAPVEGTPTIFDDVKRGIAFEFSSSPIGHSICIAIMIHPPGKSNIATQEQVAEVLENGSKE